MTELKVIDFHGKEVIDSRDVAVMVEKNHKDLLRDIRGYVEIMENSNERNFAPVDFFIPSSYVDSKGEARPCYLLTKKGCDMVANKLTGEKGILFTAAYVTAFEEMREKMHRPHVPPAVSPGGLAKLISVTRRVILDTSGTPQDVYQMMQSIFRAWNIPVLASMPLPGEIPGQLSLFDWPDSARQNQQDKPKHF